MELKPKYPMQTGGMCHVWRSPDGQFKHSFLKLNFECEADRHAGVLIIADENCQKAYAVEVQNLNEELPNLLKDLDANSVAYWWLEDDNVERQRILSSITEHPVFADVL